MQAAIIGILASNNADPEYFTSVLYPFVVDDSLTIGQLSMVRGVIWENPLDASTIGLPTITAGTLTETIIYRTYNEPLAIDAVAMGVPIMLAGTLVETIAYRTYNEPLAVDALAMGVPTIMAGSLVETVVYQNYNNGLIETANVSNPIILSGTLV
jgi:hypothetical protein